MFVGDEYALIRAVVGTLPDRFVNQKLVIPPAAITRLRRSIARSQASQAPIPGSIAARLRQLSEQAIGSILNPDPDFCTALRPADIAAPKEIVIGEARRSSIPITPYAAEMTAAARLSSQDTIWVGYEQNIPRGAQNEVGLLGIRWRLLD